MMKEARRFDGDWAALIPPPGGRAHFCGLNTSAAAFGLAETLRRRPGIYLVMTPTPVEAEDFLRDLEFFWPEGAAAGRTLICPAYEIKPFSGESPSQDMVFARLWALYQLMEGRAPLVVAASAAGSLQKSLPRSVLGSAVELIEAGEEVDRDDLVTALVRGGYYSTSMVQSQGDFSVRGGIMDVYPPGSNRPVRAEFFGDFVESLRSFRTMDQRSVDDLQEQILLPAGEVIYQPGLGSAAAAELRDLALRFGWLDLLWGPLAEKIESEQFFSGLESFLPLFYDSLDTLDDYAGPDAIRLIFEPDAWEQSALRHLERLENHMDIIRAEERPHLPLSDLYLDPDEVMSALRERTVIEARGLEMFDPAANEECVSFRVESNSDLAAMTENVRGGAGLLAPLAARVNSWLSRDLKVTLACHTAEQAHRMAELLADYDLVGRVESDGGLKFTADDPGFRIGVGFLSTGFALPAVGRAFVTEDELFGPKRRMVRRAAEEVRGIQLSSFQDLNVGDFVVHQDHGIGQYLGLVKLEAGGRENDYLHLSYKGTDKLYVPVDHLSVVGKYVGADDRAPSLDRLGGTAWEKVKAKVKESIREMADELLRLYASRKVKQGHAFGHRDSYFREFEASFEFEETRDQMEAIEDVLKDMGSHTPMDRLVCGDVGYGKTEVALRAAFRAVMDGRQAAVLVPTTVLAEQHFQTFFRRFDKYPVTVEVLSRFKKPAQQREIIKKLAEGSIDVIVGTHRLVQKDVAFKDLGLVIIDEEHRFGVAAKERLKKLRTEVDVLSMSATPIPRTLQMSLAGIRDLSVIETPPQDRLAVKTYLLKYDEPTVCEAIAREVERGGQVFFVHNRVRDIEMIAGRLRRLMPLTRFGVAHGQLKERELEEVMLGFMNREIDVLVTTTIVESGLDFPSANTIIINNADRFGLAQIYQLRGRVGRSNEQAYAYLLVRSPEHLTRDARKRLRALLDFSELGAGFKIALHDLQIRGAGNMLGAAQSGQIAAVGYEMYVQLMERAMAEIKGEPVVEEIEPEMVVGLASYIPDFYVPDTEQRLDLYRRLSWAKSPGKLNDIEKEMADRFGPPPEEVDNLLLVMELKYWLKRNGVTKLELGAQGFTLTFVETGPRNPEKVLNMVKKYPKLAKLSPEGRLFWSLEGKDGLQGVIRLKNILQGLA